MISNWPSSPEIGKEYGRGGSGPKYATMPQSIGSVSASGAAGLKHIRRVRVAQPIIAPFEYSPRSSSRRTSMVQICLIHIDRSQRRSKQHDKPMTYFGQTRFESMRLKSEEVRLLIFAEVNDFLASMAIIVAFV